MAVLNRFHGAVNTMNFRHASSLEEVTIKIIRIFRCHLRYLYLPLQTGLKVFTFVARSGVPCAFVALDVLIWIT